MWNKEQNGLYEDSASDAGESRRQHPPSRASPRDLTDFGAETERDYDRNRARRADQLKKETRYVDWL